MAVIERRVRERKRDRQDKKKVVAKVSGRENRWTDGRTRRRIGRTPGNTTPPLGERTCVRISFIVCDEIPVVEKKEDGRKMRSYHHQIIKKAKVRNNKRERIHRKKTFRRTTFSFVLLSRRRRHTRVKGIPKKAIIYKFEVRRSKYVNVANKRKGSRQRKEKKKKRTNVSFSFSESSSLFFLSS